MLVYLINNNLCAKLQIFFVLLHPKRKNVMKLYSDAALAKILDKEIFHKISTVADRMGVECYVVGGYVRDIFLERPSDDIDVVVVGSGIDVATELKKIWDAKPILAYFGILARHR